MTLTKDEREAAIEKMCRSLIDTDKAMSGYHQSHIDIKRRHAEAALDAVLPLIERTVLLKVVKLCDEEGPDRSKHETDPNKCAHERYFWEDCEQCLSDTLRALADEVRT